MAFFATLPEEIQTKAWEQKKEDLADAWFDSYISEIGVDLPSQCEEELLEILDKKDGNNFLELAKDFYEQLDNE